MKKTHQAPSITAFSPDTFKANFPIFSKKTNRDLIYFDNAATTQTPKCVIRAISHFYENNNANAHRASHRLGRAATDIHEDVRQLLAQTINADGQDIIFCKGATEGLNLIAYSLEHVCQAGDIILLSHAEHHANLVPWQALAKRQNMQIQFVPDILKDGRPTGIPDIAAVPGLLCEKTKIVALTLASNVLGIRLPLESVAKQIKQGSRYFVVDAAQAFAHQSLDCQALGCDFLVASAHKRYGPFGVGFVYGKTELLNTLPPWQFGGEMVQQVFSHTASYAKAPQRFEAGTSALADIAGFGASLRFLQQQDQVAMAAHEQSLIRSLYEALGLIPELRLFGQVEHNLGICTFSLNDNKHNNTSPFDLAHWLDEHNIAVRAGQHCAQPLYQQLHSQYGVRISVAAYNTQEDCQRTVQAILDWFELNSKTKPSFTTQKNTQLQPKQQNTHQPLTEQHLNLIAQINASQSWRARYQLIFKLGKLMPTLELLRQDHYQVDGCETRTWVGHSQQGDQHLFQIDSDSALIKGLGALLLSWFSNKTQADIVDTNWHDKAADIGLTAYLSQSRQNGFNAIAQAMLAYVDTALKARLKP